MVRFLQSAVLIFVGILATGCFSEFPNHQRNRVVRYDTSDVAVVHAWYVRLQNSATRVSRTFEVTAGSRAGAIDVAMQRARHSGWGNAAVNLVWARRAGER